VGDEFFDIAALGIDGGRGLDAKCQQRGCAEQELEVKWAAHAGACSYDPISLRCECSDMRMPKPANKVTMEVPP